MQIPTLQGSKFKFVLLFYDEFESCGNGYKPQ